MKNNFFYLCKSKEEKKFISSHLKTTMWDEELDRRIIVCSWPFGFIMITTHNQHFKQMGVEIASKEDFVEKVNRELIKNKLRK